jgi:hypothetical protein
LDNFIESLTFSGHPKITAKHRTTLEVTKSSQLTEKGDCIIGVESNKSGPDFSQDFKEILANDRTKVKIIITIENKKIQILARGHHGITVSHPEDLVIRKSENICPRTLAIRANKAAINIPRLYISQLNCANQSFFMDIFLSKD